MKGEVNMKGYLTIVSGIMLILSIQFPFFGLILFPYAFMNLVFLYKEDHSAWIRPTLQYISLAVGILAAILAVLCLLINTPDLYLYIFSIPLSLLALHGIIEFLYIRGLSSRDGESGTI